MSDSGTNFPPETYSSVFNLNTLSEDEKSVDPEEEKAEASSESPSMLDCFVTSMEWIYCVIILLSYLTSIQAESDYVTCIVEDKPKIRTFQTLVEYQANKLSFNPYMPTYQGNVVRFSCDSIERLPKNAFISFESDKIIELDLSKKGIKQVDDGAFSNLLCLHHLDLSKNKISNLTKDTFVSLDNLQTFNISGNNLTYIAPDTFYYFKYLKTLDMSYNRIKEMNKSALANIPTLEKLYLSYNRMKRVAYLYFKELIYLGELRLDHNEIAVIPTYIFGGNKILETLDLSGNGLVLLDMRTDYELPSIKNLNLSDNYLITLNVDNIASHFTNPDLTIDFNNNQFYCANWKVYLKQFNEKHIKIAPGRNFSETYYVDGMACDTLNYTLNGNDETDDSSYEFKFSEENMSPSNNDTNSVSPEKSPLVIQSHSDTGKQVIIGLAVIGAAFVILVILDYVMGVGYTPRVTRNIRRYWASSNSNDDMYVTLTPPT